jgi:hypothetical protein
MAVFGFAAGILIVACRRAGETRHETAPGSDDRYLAPPTGVNAMECVTYPQKAPPKRGDARTILGINTPVDQVLSVV